MVYYLIATLYVLGCFLLLLVVLLQQGKGGDIASAFGGGGSQTAFGARAGATVLTRATAVLGAIFMIGAVVLSIIGRPGAGSLMRGTVAPVQQPAPPIAPIAQPVEKPTEPAKTPAPQPSTLPDPNKPQPAQQKPAGPPK
jgi:preprotein translocase subunit SecG